MEAKRQIIALTGVLLILVACEAQNTPPENHPQWVIHSKVVFKEADFITAREPLPQSAFRLTFPYVAGDLYGAPNVGDFIHPVLKPDYTFEIDLNRTQADLLRSLGPTDFSVEYLKIDPPDARIARLTPLALQADGIEQVATSDWVDTRSNGRLMLVYVDKPARITGALTRNGHTVRYNIRASKAGYIWIGSIETEDNELMFTEVERPENVILALTPPQLDGELQHPGNHNRPWEIPAAINDAMSTSGAAQASSVGGLSTSSTASSTSSPVSSAADLRSVDRTRRDARARTDLPDR
jgi:hypothetical protein